MRTIYIDFDYKCHVTNDGTMTAVETDAFNGKCDAFIEGHCYEDTGKGIAIYPWKNDAELAAVQREYEAELLTDMENALAILLGGETV